LKTSRSRANASVVALPSDVSPWPTLLDFFADRFSHVSRGEWEYRFESGDIAGVGMGSDRQSMIARAEDVPCANGKLTYFRRIANETRIPFDEVIVFQNEHIVVADKPHFLPVVPRGQYVDETLLARLRRKLDVETLTPIHRIDRETAGLVVFSVRPEERGAYQSLFRERSVRKVYEAIAPYRESLVQPIVYRSRLVDADHFMQMREAAGQANSETQIRMIEHVGAFARYELVPLTGKRHQLRAHMCALGAPIVNDRIYPRLLSREVGLTFGQPLQLLAKVIAFVDPITGASRVFQSERQLQTIA
jgi:tRNA pseudouridine32 synthase / 23S rRNA pseudouridine746 synthase